MRKGFEMKPIANPFAAFAKWLGRKSIAAFSHKDAFLAGWHAAMEYRDSQERK